MKVFSSILAMASVGKANVDSVGMLQLQQGHSKSAVESHLILEEWAGTFEKVNKTHGSCWCGRVEEMARRETACLRCVEQFDHACLKPEILATPKCCPKEVRKFKLLELETQSDPNDGPRKIDTERQHCLGQRLDFEMKLRQKERRLKREEELAHAHYAYVLAKVAKQEDDKILAEEKQMFQKAEEQYLEAGEKYFGTSVPAWRKAIADNVEAKAKHADLVNLHAHQDSEFAKWDGLSKAAGEILRDMEAHDNGHMDFAEAIPWAEIAWADCKCKALKSPRRVEGGDFHKKFECPTCPNQELMNAEPSTCAYVIDEVRPECDKDEDLLVKWAADEHWDSGFAALKLP